MASRPAPLDDDGYFNLGTYRRPVTTQSPEAARWCNRGLMWCYGFNHEEAEACFERAIQLDAHCIFGYWGLAYALGPNYNKPWKVFEKMELERNLLKAYKAVQKAKTIMNDSNSSEVERAMILALEQRYPVPDSSYDNSQWNANFAIEMGKVYRRYGDEDLDVATVYADALMNLTPWSLWDLRTGEPAPETRTLEIKAILERGIASTTPPPSAVAPASEASVGDHLQPQPHPGLLHLYIHLMEMSATPEKALAAADSLRMLVPDAGHLNHMPSHIDILCGDYRSAMISNLHAIQADERYLARHGAQNFYSLYRAHDFHFRIYAAMFAGNSAVALETVSLMEATLSDEVLRIPSPPMADWLEGFRAMRVHVLVRFGRWEEILRMELPRDAELYCVTTAMMHYGRGVAFAATDRLKEAERERELFHAALARVPPSRTLFNNACSDILAIGAVMLDGEVEYRRGAYDVAFGHLRRAVRQCDELPYDEPWGWMQPPRHALGALLLEQGHVQEAAAVFCADLGFDDTLPRALQHPNNVWAMKGYHDCLTRLHRLPEARIVQKYLVVYSALADVPISVSCFCATRSLL